MNSLISFIRQADILGVKASLLTRDGSKKTKNVYGGVISIIMLILIISSLIYFLYEFFARKKLSLISNFVEDPKISLNSFESIPFMLRLTGDGSKLLPQNYYSAVSKLAFYEESNGQTRYQDLSLEPCELHKHFNNEYLKHFKEINQINSYLCPRYNETFSLYGIYGSSNYTFIRISISPCLGKVACGNRSEIIKALSGAYLDFVTMTNSLNHNSETPNEALLVKKRISVSNSIFQRIRFYYETINYSTDIGYIFEQNRLARLYAFSNKYDTELDLRDVVDKEFLRINIHNFALTTNYYRTYMKAQTLLANIGGIINGLSLLGMLVSYSVSKNLMEEDLVNTIFDKNSSFEISQNIKLKDKSEVSNPILTNNKLTSHENFNTIQNKSIPDNQAQPRNMSDDYNLANNNLKKANASSLNTLIKVTENLECTNLNLRNPNRNRLHRLKINKKSEHSSHAQTTSNNFTKSNPTSKSVGPPEINFMKTNFKFRLCNLLDPFQICLSKTEKSFILEKMTRVNKLLKVDNMLSTFKKLT